MKRLATLLLFSLFFTEPGLAQTTRTTLSQSSWVDVCAAPCSVAVLSGIAAFVVDSTPPASIDAPAIGWTPENGLFQNPANGSHVYARAVSAGSSVSSIPGSASTGSASGATGGFLNGVMSLSRIPSSDAGHNVTLAKAGRVRAATYQGCNTTAVTVYLRLYDAATVDAVTPGTTPVYAGPYPFPANNCSPSTNFVGNAGVSFANGLVYAFGSSPSDDDGMGIDAGTITAFQLGYQ